MPRIVQIDGKPHVVIGDKAMPCDENGVISGCWSEEKPNATGGQDCTVHVPCLQIVANVNKPG